MYSFNLQVAYKGVKLLSNYLALVAHVQSA